MRKHSCLETLLTEKTVFVDVLIDDQTSNRFTIGLDEASEFLKGWRLKGLIVECLLEIVLHSLEAHLAVGLEEVGYTRCI